MIVYAPREPMKDTQEPRLDQSITYHISVDMTLVLPTILILALENILQAQTTAALMGTVVGYILAGIGKEDPQKSKAP